MIIMHTEFLARVCLSAAQRLFSDFTKVMGDLETAPFQYPYADELDVPGIPPEMYRKCLFDGRYKALYLVDGDTVYIDAIIDCRQENKGLYTE
jgi:hypothetical protein